jgi:hypothetical protein
MLPLISIVKASPKLQWVLSNWHIPKQKGLWIARWLMKKRTVVRFLDNIWEFPLELG